MPRIRQRKGKSSPEGEGAAPSPPPAKSRRRQARPAAGGDQVATHLFVRVLGGIYVLAFVSLGWQIQGLVGPQGVFPFTTYLAAAKSQLGGDAWRQVPTLLWFSSSESALDAVWLLGAVAATLVIFGRLVAPGLAVAWFCYLSLVVVGRDFLAFQWDNLLLETGLLAIFLLPLRLHLPFAQGSPLPVPLWLLRFLLFRLMLGSGLVKLFSGDPAWRSLSALTVHYETQPLPTPLGWWAHQLPAGVHQASAAAMFAIELLIPLLIFAPPRFRRLAFWPLAGLQVLIAATGNYGFFNLLTLALCLLLLDDGAFPAGLARRAKAEKLAGPQRIWEWAFWPAAAVLGLLSVVVFLSTTLRVRADWPSPLVSLYQQVAPLRSVNSYGLFAVMTQERHELFIEGSRDGREWKAYGLPFKPEDENEAPPMVAPHMPRLDWQLWFVALGERDSPFLLTLLGRLAEGDRAALELFAHNPFPDGPPAFVRVRKERWRFTDRATRAKTGAWWSRVDEGDFYPPTRGDRLSRPHAVE